MKKNRVVVALLSISLLTGGAGLTRAFTPITPGASANGAKAWVPPFAAASANTLAKIHDFLGSDTGQGVLQQNPTLEVLLRLQPSSEAHLRITGAMGLAEDLAPQEMATVLNERFRANEKTIVDAVASRVDELASQVGQGAIGADELHAAANELAAFLVVSGTSEKVRAILAVAGSALSDRTLASARKLALQLLPSAPEDSAVVGSTNEDPGLAEQEMARAKNLIEDLQREKSRGNREVVAARLQELGLTARTEAAQRFIVRGLLEDTRRADEPAIDTSYDARVIGVVKSITAKTQFDTVTELALVMIGANANWINSPYDRSLVDAMESMALGSTDRIKDLTIAILSRKAAAGRSEWFSAGSKAFLEGKIASLQKAKATAEVPAPQGKDEKDEPRPIAPGFGIAALFASLIPTVVGIGAFFGPITMHGMALTPVGQAILLAIGVPMMIFGARVMRANERSSHTGDNSAFPGFLIGMGSIFVELPALKSLITGDMDMPVNTMIAAAMLAVTALGSLAIDSLGKRAKPNAASPWVAFLGYIAGMALMILGAKFFGPMAILGGLVLLIAVGFGSMFLGKLWNALKALGSKVKNKDWKKPDLGLMGRWLPKLGFAPQGITPQAGALIGFLVGIFLSLAFYKVSLAFAMMPIICPVIGYYWASRRK